MAKTLLEDDSEVTQQIQNLHCNSDDSENSDDSDDSDDSDGVQEEVTQQIQNLNLHSDGDEAYYVHIDILPGGNAQGVPEKINKYMLTHDAFDPRVCEKFPSDLVKEHELTTADSKSSKENQMENENHLRKLTNIKASRYEFWKVR